MAAGADSTAPSVVSDLLFAIDAFRGSCNFAGLVRFLSSGSEAVRSRAAAELRSAASVEGVDRDAVKAALRESTTEAAVALLSWIELQESEEAELRSRVAEVAGWRDPRDVRALLRAVAAGTEPADVRSLASDAVWNVWKSDVGERGAIELALGSVAEMTEESRALYRRIEAAKAAAVEERSAEERSAEAARRRLERPTLPTKQVFSTILVWDLETRSLLRTLVGHTLGVYGFAFDPAGRRLASGSDDRTVRLWDLESGACLCALEDRSMSYVYAVAWEAAGALLASGSRDNTVRLWDTASGALRHTLEGHKEGVSAVAAHPFDDLLASGSDDHSVRVWRWSSGAHVRTLEGHEGAVCSLAASNTWLASGSVDRRVRVWSWARGECVRVLDGFSSSLYLNSVSWRDSTLATLESDGTVRVWDASSADPREWSCAGLLPSKASFPHGVTVLWGGRVACAAPGDFKTIAVWG